MELKEQKFGIEIEMTGITRAKAAEVTAGYFGTRVKYLGTYYDTYAAIDTEGLCVSDEKCGAWNYLYSRS